MQVRFLVGATLFGAAVGSMLLGACGSLPEDDSTAPAESAQVVAPSRLLANGLLPGMKPKRGVGANQFATPQCPTPKLTYFGGPIVQTPVIVPVFWNSNVNAELVQKMPQFYADITVSSFWPWLQEYNTVGLSTGFNQAILPGTATAGVTLTPSVCSASTTTSCNLSDTQIQNELTAQINANVLPAPTLDCTGNSQTIYMIEFPHNVRVSGPQGTGSSCVQFCAYHNTGTYGASKIPLIYGVLMDQYTGGCATGCGSNGNAFANSTDTASHELVEAVTDPDIGLDTSAQYAAPAGWASNSCGEIGDICDDNGAGDTITVNGRTWVVQEQWSNKQHVCASSGTVLPVCVGTVSSTCRKCNCGDNGVACSGGTCQNGACTSTCTPLTACPAGDNCGTVPNGCGGTIDCGTCTMPQTCGGGTPKNPNVCGCTPLTACPAGDNCGTVPDGCGGTVDCGTCTMPQTCGGGTPKNPNVCGCTPLAACPADANCGTVTDGCGGTVTCGTCGANQVCSGNLCVAGTSSSSSAGGAGGSSSSSAVAGTGGAGSTSGNATVSAGSGSGEGGSGTGTPGQQGGCGCKTAGDTPGTSNASLSALGMLALAGMMRRRRRG